MDLVAANPGQRVFQFNKSILIRGQNYVYIQGRTLMYSEPGKLFFSGQNYVYGENSGNL